MLVFVSGASYALSAKEKQILHTKEYFEYIFNRFKRLIRADLDIFNIVFYTVSFIEPLWSNRCLLYPKGLYGFILISVRNWFCLG